MPIVIKPERVKAGHYRLKHGEETVDVKKTLRGWRVSNGGRFGWPAYDDRFFHYYSDARDYANEWLKEHA